MKDLVRSNDAAISTVELSVLLVIFGLGMAAVLGWMLPLARSYEEGIDLRAAFNVTEVAPPLLNGIDSISPLTEYPSFGNYLGVSPGGTQIDNVTRENLLRRVLSGIVRFSSSEVCGVVFIPAAGESEGCDSNLSNAEILLSLAHSSESEVIESAECEAVLFEGSSCLSRELESLLIQWDCPDIPLLAIFEIEQAKYCSVMRLETEMLHYTTRLSVSRLSTTSMGGSQSTSSIPK